MVPSRTRRQPPYNVVVLSDEEHTFEYVIDLLVKIFRHSLPTAQELTWRIHSAGRAVVYTTHKEKAELKLMEDDAPLEAVINVPASKVIPQK